MLEDADDLLALRGSTQPWTRNIERGKKTYTELHRLDILTGIDVLDGTVPQASMERFTGKAWIVGRSLGSDYDGQKGRTATIDLYPLPSRPGQMGDEGSGHRRLVTLPGQTDLAPWTPMRSLSSTAPRVQMAFRVCIFRI